MDKRICTLCVVHQHPRVLLGMKKRGFGEGKWNGFGGKVKDGESVEEAMTREVQEEICVKVRDVRKLGVLEFSFPDGGEMQEVHVFKASEVEGEPRETEEMAPKWFFIDEIPFSDMWPDDPFWFPLFMRDRKFRGEFVFEGKDRLVRYSLQEVQEV